MTKLTDARYRTLLRISKAGLHGIRPRGADLTNAYWLRQERLVETFNARDKMQLQYRISKQGLEAIRLRIAMGSVRSGS
jgi:uncharacterized protein YjhX (UPF0386 family)